MQQAVYFQDVQMALDAANAWRSLKMQPWKATASAAAPAAEAVPVKRAPCIPPKSGPGRNAPELKAPPTWPYVPPPGVVVSEGALGRRASELHKPVTWKGPPPELQRGRLPSCKAPPPPPPQVPLPPTVPPPPPVPPPDGPGPLATFEGLPPTLVAATLLTGYTAEGAEGATAGNTAGASATMPEVFFVGEVEVVSKG